MNKRIKRLRKEIVYYLMALPGLTYLFINNYMPLPGLVLAFKNYNAKDGIWRSPWAGFDNFKYLFMTNDAFVITRNTVLYNLVFITLNTVFGISAAILLSRLRAKRVRNIYQIVMLLPHMISSVIISYLVFSFLGVEHGLINSMLTASGKEAISWYTEKQYWPFILVIVNVWKSIGYQAILYLSSIVSIDDSYYEAAVIDGANSWQQITKITLPLLKPTIIMLVLLAVGRIFNSDFGLFYQVPMNSGALFPVTNTIDTYVYRGLIELGTITRSAAAGMYQSIVGFILVLTANLIVRKIDRDNALF
ncbi:ABC transporter permease [Lachnotalea sp. AF33-28]|jgi:putative aldouronate transport system permease protein|uniref:ABC transporter permease n=1 Tax=Lachnotalea sp. AF33-28 TaxID=2292046 RepID=UPI0015A0C676|nr:ABC transporter permease subunit [Lachnotalea sp. AF33-28]